MYLESQHKSALCLLSVDPSLDQLKFMASMSKIYDVFVAIDSDFKQRQDNVSLSLRNKIKFINVSQGQAQKLGYCCSTYSGNGIIEVSTRDKALYFFCEENNLYKNVWMVEDDVFIPTSKTLNNIDLMYPNADLLCSKLHTVDEKWFWHLNAKEEFSKNLIFRSMVCALRCSSNMLKAIKKSANKKKYLEMDELLFANIAKENNLNISSIKELEHLVFYEHDLPFAWSQISKINLNNLYHPCKGYAKQSSIRSLIKPI